MHLLRRPTDSPTYAWVVIGTFLANYSLVDIAALTIGLLLPSISDEMDLSGTQQGLPLFRGGSRQPRLRNSCQRVALSLPSLARGQHRLYRFSLLYRPQRLVPELHHLSGHAAPPRLCLCRLQGAQDPCTASVGFPPTYSPCQRDSLQRYR